MSKDVTKLGEKHMYYSAPIGCIMLGYSRTKSLAEREGWNMEDLVASQAYGSLQGRKNYLLEEIKSSGKRLSVTWVRAQLMDTVICCVVLSTIVSFMVVRFLLLFAICQMCHLYSL